MRVEITLKSGVTVWAQTDSFTKRQRVSNGSTYLTWSTHRSLGVPSLLYLDIDEVAAVVTYASTDSQAGQDERDAEAAQSGGDQVEPG